MERKSRIDQLFEGLMINRCSYFGAYHCSRSLLGGLGRKALGSDLEYSKLVMCMSCHHLPLFAESVQPCQLALIKFQYSKRRYTHYVPFNSSARCSTLETIIIIINRWMTANFVLGCFLFRKRSLIGYWSTDEFLLDTIAAGFNPIYYMEDRIAASGLDSILVDHWINTTRCNIVKADLKRIAVYVLDGIATHAKFGNTVATSFNRFIVARLFTYIDFKCY